MRVLAYESSGTGSMMAMALALGHVEAGRHEQMRSLVKPVPIAASG